MKALKKNPRKARRVVRIYTIGKKGRTFDTFFATLRKARVKRLIDIRRRNTWEVSAGFTVKSKLPGYLEEQCGAEYVHELLLAPTDDLLAAYRREKMAWTEYRETFLTQLAERRVEEKMHPDQFAIPTVLLCACATADQCHRSLVLEYLASKWPQVKLKAIHL